MTHATVFKRIIAYSFDCLIAFSVLVIPQIIIFLVTGGAWFTSLKTSTQIESWILLTISIPVWLYFSIFESSKSGAAFGKKLFHLRVCNYQQEKLKFGQAFLRTIIKLLPWELTHISLMFPEPLWNSAIPSRFPTGLYLVYSLLILYIAIPFFNKRKQSLDDMIARTFVIYQKGKT
jgi:uncharacterized RDD family membrane protein YckC